MEKYKCQGCDMVKDIYIVDDWPDFCLRCHAISHAASGQNLPFTHADLIALVRLVVEDRRRL